MTPTLDELVDDMFLENYRFTVLTTDSGDLQLYMCCECGAIVMNTRSHFLFHRDLRGHLATGL